MRRLLGAAILAALFVMLTVTPAQTQTGHTLYLPLVMRGVSVGAWAYGPEAAAMLPPGAVMAMTANWSDVEPQHGVYLWDELDQIYNASLGQVFISVHGVPAWARPLGCSVECCPVDGQPAGRHGLHASHL